MTETNTLGKEKAIYFIGILLLSAWFTTSGFMEITKNPLVWDHTIKMGYPPFFIISLGIAKILGVVILLIPNKLNWLKEWVFAALFMDVIFAAIPLVKTKCPIAVKSSIAERAIRADKANSYF